MGSVCDRKLTPSRAKSWAHWCEVFGKCEIHLFQLFVYLQYYDRIEMLNPALKEMRLKYEVAKQIIAHSYSYRA